MNSIRRKLIIFGDGDCGKSTFLLVSSGGTFPEPGTHRPNVFETFIADVNVDGHQVELALWDTVDQEEYDRLRPLTYANAHVILISFAVDCPDSLNSVEERWITEASHFFQGLPIILVGFKKDLREMSQRPVTHEEGMDVARRINAIDYLECSAKTGEGVHEVMQCAARAALLPHNKKKRRCVIV